MTMAPEPGTRIVWMSVRFDMFRFLADQGKELPKNIVRVMRTRRSFGMELYTQHRLIFQPQTFERIIIQTLVSDFHLNRIQIPLRNTIIMILSSNKNFTTGKILNWMISAMMPEF